MMRPRKAGPKPATKHVVHPLLRDLSDLIEESFYSRKQLFEEAELAPATSYSWFNNGREPGLVAFDTILSKLGKKLAIVDED